MAYRYRIVVLEHGDYFCKFMFWSTPSRFDAGQTAFEQIIAGLK